MFESSKDKPEDQVHQEEITLRNFTVTFESKLWNQTIRESGIRDKAKALVVGLERNGQRQLNPESTAVLQEGDIVWIVGVKRKIDDFLWNKTDRTITALQE